MSLKDKEKWDSKYAVAEYISGIDPCAWLEQNADLLSGRGKALDLAMGEGRNAVFLASLGYDVLGLDISPVAVEKALALAARKNTRIEALAADLDDYPLGAETFDLIVCFHFLERKLFPGIRAALRPGGLLFFETYSADYLKYRDFKKEWTLGYNELLQEFRGWRILRYREMDAPGKATASLAARKTEKPQ